MCAGVSDQCLEWVIDSDKVGRTSITEAELIAWAATHFPSDEGKAK